MKILIVEDEVITALLMERQLKRMGFQVSDHVTTGELAILSVQANAPDVILMDIQLAGVLNGIEASIEIRKTSLVPIIFITGFDDATLRKQSEQVNPLAYMIKPFDEVLLKKLLDAL